MSPLEIKIEMMKQGVTQQYVADQLEPKVSRSMIGMVIWRKAASDRVRQKLSEVLKIPAQTLFPDIYYGNGRFKPGRPPKEAKD